MRLIIFLLPYLLELLLIIHMFKNNKPFVWLWLIVFLPYLGGLVYLIMEFIPDVIHGNAVHKARKTVSDLVHPDRKIKEAEDLLKRQDTIGNRIRLADLYKENGIFEKAVSLYEESLTGPYKNDFDINLKCVECLFLSGNKEEAKKRYLKLKNDKGLTPSQEIFIYQITDDYEKLKDIFDRDANFEIGYILSKKYKEEENTEAIRNIISEMEYNLKTYKYLQKTDNKIWYKKTKALI
ncbi:MAG: hypothetical protein KBT21_11590 [Treponema sp.]|nr:hypothetical protein [Candidatus Treponema merdequi]